MIVTLYGVVTSVLCKSGKPRKIEVTLDKSEGQYTTHSFEFENDALNLEQRVAVMVQPVEVPIAEQQSAQIQFPEGYKPLP